MARYGSSYSITTDEEGFTNIPSTLCSTITMNLATRRPLYQIGELVSHENREGVWHSNIERVPGKSSNPEQDGARCFPQRMDQYARSMEGFICDIEAEYVKLQRGEGAWF